MSGSSALGAGDPLAGGPALARLWRALAVLAWALALLGSTLGLAVGRAVYQRGVVYGDPGPALPDLDGPERAINTQLEVEPDAEAQRRSLQMIRAAGFGWIRQQFSWAAIEGSGKGQFFDAGAGRSTWEPYDQIVRLAQEEGLMVVARLDLPPAWARPPGSTKTHPPLNVQDYGDFAAQFVAHYRGQIRHVQLWNEPNLIVEWGDQPVDAAAYVELLKAGYLGAKRADPSIRVLSGMLAPTLEPDVPGARGLDDLLYLDRMYRHGAKPYFDILAGNAYGLRTGPEDRQVGVSYTNFPRVLLTREVMLRHEDGGKAVWVTEFGWNALPPGWTGDPSPWGEVSAPEQASYIVGAYARAQREWPWLGPLALWLFRQPRPDPRDPTAYFGLVDEAWRPRPAYDALRATAPGATRRAPGETGGAAPERGGHRVFGPGVYQESAEGLTFTGTWQWTPDGAASLGAVRESPISGATLRLRFRGTKLEVLAPVGPSRGTAYVKINGAAALANRLPFTGSGQAILDFYAPDAVAQRRLVIADHLPDREHEAELTVTGSHSPLSDGPGVGIDAVIVSRAPPVLPPALLGAAWGATLVAGLWMARSLARSGCRSLGHRLATPVNPWADPGAIPEAIPPHAPLAGGVGQPHRHAPFTAPQLVPLSGPGRLAGAWGAGGVALGLAGRLAGKVAWRKAGALAIAAGLPLAPLSVATPLGRFSPVELLMVLYAGANVAWLYLAGQVRGRYGAFAVPALLIVVAGLISLAVAEYPRLALRELRTVVLGPAVFYVLTRAVLRGSERDDRGGDALHLAGAFLMGAAGATLLALGQVALGRDLVAAEGVTRAAALYRSPNNLALLLDRALPLAFALALYRRPGRLRWLFAGAALLCAWALFFTYSRGAWLASGVSLAVVAIPYVGGMPRQARRRLLLWGTVGAVPFLLLVIGLALRVERLRSLLEREGTAFLRLRLWQAALEMVRDHPLWGIGLDQFLYLYPRYMHPDAWREPNLSHPHNLVLDFWLRLGILGLLALAWVIWEAIRRTRRQGALGGEGARAPGWPAGSPAVGVKGSSPRGEGAALGTGPPGLRLGALGALTAVLLHGLIDNSYFVIDLAYSCWILLLLIELSTETSSTVDP